MSDKARLTQGVAFSTVICGVILYLPLSSNAQLYSTRYVTLSSPVLPTSYEECDALARDFQQEINQLIAQHSQCLAGSRSDSGGGGTCSKAACQGVHTAIDEAQRRSGAEGRVCRDKVGKYLADKRQEEERQRRYAEEDEKARRDRAERDKNSKAAATTNERDQQLSRERMERDDRAAREAKEKAEKDEARQREERQRQEEAARAEQQHREAEARRQAYLLAVAETARQRKNIWLDRIQNGVPKLVNETQSFMDLVLQKRSGDDAIYIRDLVIAADKLVEASQNTKRWIDDPLGLSPDAIVGDAVQLVRSETLYQSTDDRLHTILRGIQKLDEIVHNTTHLRKLGMPQCTTNWSDNSYRR